MNEFNLIHEMVEKGGITYNDLLKIAHDGFREDEIQVTEDIDIGETEEIMVEPEETPEPDETIEMIDIQTPQEPTYKHYIRIDFVGNIVKGFSDAFEQPADSDICINTQGSYQFRLTPSGEENPDLFAPDGNPIFRYVDGVISVIETNLFSKTTINYDEEVITFNELRGQSHR